jgi:hypothetical protein
MYRRSSGFPGLSFCRIGTVDDFELHEGKLRPQAEQFVEGRVVWLKAVEGVKQVEGMSTGWGGSWRSIQLAVFLANVLMPHEISRLSPPAR